MRDDRRVPRRAVLAGAAAIAAGGAGALAAAAKGCDSDASRNDTHQPGIVTPPPDKAVFAAYDVLAADRGALEALFRRLTDVIDASPAEVTVAVGESLFDQRYGLAAEKPRRLTRMPSFPNDVLDEATCHGDLLVQICGGGPLAPLRDSGLKLRWQIEGFRSENTLAANGRPSMRNLFGFREGVGNPDPNDADEMNRLVWVRSGGDEPAWATGGTYQVVRIVRFATELWDADPLAQQEAVFGRRKSDGAPLGRDREDATFDYADDPAGHVIALNAHIRLANPRTAQTGGNQILRRGYSYRRGRDGAGRTDEGIIFVCFQQDLERGFATVQRRLAGQPLDRYILTTGGGYFFALPGADRQGYLGQRLIDATRP